MQRRRIEATGRPQRRQLAVTVAGQDFRPDAEVTQDAQRADGDGASAGWATSVCRSASSRLSRSSLQNTGGG